MSYFQLSTLHTTALYAVVYTLSPVFNIIIVCYSILILLVKKCLLR